MYGANPGEINFRSSKCELRVTKGSSYQESTVNSVNSGHIFCTLSHQAYLAVTVVRGYSP